MAPFYIVCFHTVNTFVFGLGLMDSMLETMLGTPAEMVPEVTKPLMDAMFFGSACATSRSPRSSTRCRPTRPSSSSRTWCSRCSWSLPPGPRALLQRGHDGRDVRRPVRGDERAGGRASGCTTTPAQVLLAWNLRARAREREKRRPRDVLLAMVASATRARGVGCESTRRPERARARAVGGRGELRDGADLDDAGGLRMSVEPPLTKRRRAAAPGRALSACVGERELQEVHDVRGA